MSEVLQQKMAAIVHAVGQGHYRYILHGAQQRIARRIHGREVVEAIEMGEIIEDYPQHHYGPACLILGRTKQGRALHILCSVRDRWWTSSPSTSQILLSGRRT